MTNEKVNLHIQSWLSWQDATIGLVLCSFMINSLGLIFPISILQFYDRIIPNEAFNTLYALVSIILVALILEMILKLVRAYVSAWASAKFTHNIGCKLFYRLLYSDLAAFEEDSPGIHLEKFNSAQSLKEYLCGQNLIMLVDLPFILVYILLIAFINVYIVIVPVTMITLLYIFSKISDISAETITEKKSSQSELKLKFLIEVISGIHTVKGLSMEEQMLRRYEKLHREEIMDNFSLIQSSASSARISGFMAYLNLILICAVGGFLVITNQITVGGLAACILLSGRIMQPVSQLIIFKGKAKKIKAAKENFDYIMQHAYEYNKDGLILQNLVGKIELKDVNFKFAESQNYILKNINLIIDPKSIIAISGESLSCKTTLLNLIGTLFKPNSGTILYDGYDTRDLNLDYIRTRVGFMMQESELFNGSILDNIALFTDKDCLEQVEEVAKEIGIHDYIENMNNGYQTEVGGGTSELISRGDKQQILMARALFNNPKIILFDEANSDLDQIADAKLIKYFNKLKGHTTIVMVTNNSGLLALADIRYSLSNGELIELNGELIELEEKKGDKE